MNKHSLPPLNNKRSKSTIFIPLIVIIISFHLILLYIYVNRKSDKEQGSDRAVSSTKVENESYSDTPIQNQLIAKDEESIELELIEDSTENSDENTEDSSLPALISKSDNQIEGNPNYQTLFPTNNQAMNVGQEQNIPPMPMPSENMQANIPQETTDKQVKKRRHSKRKPIFDEPYIDEPMYPPVYQQPEPQVTEQEIKDSALLSVDLPETERPQLVPIDKTAKETMQKIEQAKEQNDKLQKQLSSSIQNVRALNARKIEQEKQLARRAYEDSLALKQLKNQTRQEKNPKVQKAEIKKPVKAEPKKITTVETKTTPKATTAIKQIQKTEPKKAQKVETKPIPKVEPKKAVTIKTEPKKTPKVETKKVQKSEPKKAVQPQKKAPTKVTAPPKVKEVTKTAEPKKQEIIK